MKISNGTMFGIGFILAIAAVMPTFTPAQRVPASLVSGPTPPAGAELTAVNPYRFSQIQNHYGSALYNEQVFRQTQSSDENLLQALKVERAAAVAANDPSVRYPNNAYDQKIRELENRMTITRLQQGYNLNNSYLQMAYTFASTRNGLSAQQVQMTQAQLQQLASLNYINMSGNGAMYETPTLESPYLVAQVGANTKKYAPLPTVDIPTLDDVPDDVNDVEGELPVQNNTIATPVAPVIAQ